MSDIFRVRGGKPLSGTISVSGSKNAALPILAATVAIPHVSVLRNLPDISDVHKFCDMICFLGGKVKKSGTKTIVDTTNLMLPSPPNFQHPGIGKMRASILLLSALLTRFGEIKMAFPGGCVLGKRSAEAHLRAFTALGAEIISSSDSIHLRLPQKKYTSGTIILPEISVTATENALIAAAFTNGTTHIRLAAAEPHVQNLCEALISTGTEIDGVGSHFLTVRGNTSPQGISAEITPDYLEAGTFILAGILTDSEITVQNIIASDLDIFWEKLREVGAEFVIDEKKREVHTKKRKRDFSPTKIQTGVFPQFPTDLHPQFGVLMTQCAGASSIFETLFERKFAYLLELEKLGADITISNPHQFLIMGPKKLHGAPVASQDIRAGAAVLLATLCAEGESEISNIHYLDRGYEKLEEKMSAIGADISREVR
ncbi:UDP-N-acetylglucosamine 1-carboxyvinyltransferase [Candidatus Peregrinibacteria bacterium]|nr:MAG: UDP-N-acetylglucosamine 1-carboxyvinyltransferase [Candidatus Peregrinibacteria bacterium]